VVEYVYRSRYATGSQIRRRFTEYLPSERTAQYQLANLVQLGHLATSPVRSTSPNFPFVYHATGRGVNLVSQIYASLGRQWSAAATEQFRSRGQSLDSILHEVLLTEFDLAVSKTVESRGDLELLLTERRYFRRERQLRFSHQGKVRRVVPDSGFLLRFRSQTSGRLAAQRSSLLLHLVELDNGTMPVARILEKYLRYHCWAESPEGRQYLTDLYRRFGRTDARPNFRLLVIAHAKTDASGDMRRLTDLFAQALLLPSSMRDRIWLTTAEDLRRHQEDNPPLSAAIWLRARDARRWLPAYRTFCEQLPGGRGNKRYAHQRRFVAQQLAALPRHPLFPHPHPS
jgi:hypothetical protein